MVVAMVKLLSVAPKCDSPCKVIALIVICITIIVLCILGYLDIKETFNTSEFISEANVTLDCTDLHFTGQFSR